MTKLKSPSNPQRLSIYSPAGRAILSSAVQLLNHNDCSSASVENSPAELLDDRSTASTVCCSLCGFQWNEREEQVDHYRSQWHVENVRRRVRGKEPLPERTFDILIGDRRRRSQSAEASGDEVGEESESENSTSSSSDAESDNDDEPARLVVSSQMSRYVCFKDNKNCVYGVEKVLLKSTGDQDRLSLLTRLRYLPESRIVAVFLLAGGRFAAAVFQGEECIAHTCKCRYTTRRKQGGSQLRHDASLNNPSKHSAGANLRRYNEMALREDIHTVLTEWKQHLTHASHIFLRCSSYDKPIFFNPPHSHLTRLDPRVSHVPFATQRPTFSETKRVNFRVTAVHSFGSYDDFMQLYATSQAADATVKPVGSKGDLNAREYVLLKEDTTNRSHAHHKRKHKGAGSPTKENTVITEEDVLVGSVKEEENAVSHLEPPKPTVSTSAPWHNAIYTAVKKRELEALQAAISAALEAASADDVSEFLNRSFGIEQRTFMHMLAADGAETSLPILRYLLLDQHCDVSKTDHKERTPYDVAQNRTVRQIFIDVRRQLEPADANINWGSIPVPPDLATEEARQARLAEKRRKARLARKERDRDRKDDERREKEEEAERARFLALPEREKRALAAERRLMGGCRCHQCGSVYDIVPFEYADFKFCSIDCLKQHRNMEA